MIFKYASIITILTFEKTINNECEIFFKTLSENFFQQFYLKYRKSLL